MSSLSSAKPSLLSPKRLLFVSGKGGAGKSSVAAALALLFSCNSKTLLVELNAPNSAPGEPCPSQPLLWTANLQFQPALREYALMVLKYEALYRTVFENRWVKQLLRFIPSISELVLLGKLLHLAREKTPDGQFRFDKIVVDAPATGHALRLLAIPSVLLRTVPPGALAEDARWMQALLQAPTTAALLVSLPSEMAVQETLELYHALTTEMHMEVAALLLNRFTPPLFSKKELSHPALSNLQPLLQLAKQHDALANESKAAFLRLSQCHAPLFKLPHTSARKGLAEHLNEMDGLL